MKHAPRAKKMCPLHGTPAQPAVCQTPAKEMHRGSPELNKRGESCDMCGKCCTAQIFLGHDKSVRTRVAKAVLANGRALSAAGVDPKRIAERILETGWVPNREAVDAELHPLLSPKSCALLVVKQEQKGRRPTG